MANLNTSAHLGDINAKMDTWQGRHADAEGDIQKVVLGDPTVSAGEARQRLHVAMQVADLLRTTYRAWLQEAKEEQRMMREMRLDGTKDLATA